MVTGNSPSIWLDQDGTSGFTPQVWDIAGNEANFFIRDVTAGSRLPFRIRPGAPTSSIDMAASGNVGFGTALPNDGDGLAERFIEVKSTTGDARVVVDSKDGAGQFGEVLFQRDNVCAHTLSRPLYVPAAYDRLNRIPNRLMVKKEQTKD